MRAHHLLLSFIATIVFGCLPSADKGGTGLTSSDADADADADTDADADADADADTGDTADSTDTGDTGSSGPSTDACAEELIAALDWFDGEPTGTLSGVVDFGQTHVIREDETRIAPPLIESRAAMFLFTPFDSIEDDADVRVAAWNGETLLGVITLNPPSALPQALEQDLTAVALEPWSPTAWSAFLPWTWFEEGYDLEVGTQFDGALHTYSHTLTDLGAPHSFTISRSKMVLFGEPDKDTQTYSAEKLAQDYFATYPSAELRWVDAAPWRLDEIVVNASGGPALVTSEGERVATTTDPDRWNIIKHQFALRMSLANTGRGLAFVLGWEGDSSPYSFGTSVAMGWVMNDDGSYSDLDNAPYAAGWTGWTAMWLGECGNTFIHEVGHSATLLHFTAGTATSWGIADEYPQDGVNLATHPWGFDTTRQQFRTWYRVDSGGPVDDGAGGWTGKRDPMNGGEGANAITCFPQYTAFHGSKIQRWNETSPTLANVDGTPGIYAWDAETRSYLEHDMGETYETPVAVGVPTVTIIGTLGNTPEANHIYPPMYWESGNVFTMPDPEGAAAVSVYEGSRHYLQIDYADGTQERALINKGGVDDTGLYLFSLNLELDKDPVQITLFGTTDGFPEMDLSTAISLYTRDIEGPEEALPEVVHVGRGFIANGAVSLTQRCEPGLNCDSRQAETMWRWSTENLHFVPPDGTAADTTVCSADEDYTSLDVPVVDESGSTATLVLHAQRVVSTANHSRSSPINDITPWIDAPNLSQGLRIWIPYEENRDMPSGTWTNDGEYVLTTMADGEAVASTPVQISLNVRDVEPVNLNEPFESPPLTAEGSSMYYTVEDPSMGPRTRIWWGDSSATLLTIPVLHADTGELTTIVVNSWKKSCNLGWGTLWNLNSAQAADSDCTQSVYLEIPEAGNEHLSSGSTYSSPVSQPVVFEGRRWHSPDAAAIVGTFTYAMEYTAP